MQREVTTALAGISTITTDGNAVTPPVPGYDRNMRLTAITWAAAPALAPARQCADLRSSLRLRPVPRLRQAPRPAPSYDDP